MGKVLAVSHIWKQRSLDRTEISGHCKCRNFGNTQSPEQRSSLSLDMLCSWLLWILILLQLPVWPTAMPTSTFSGLMLYLTWFHYGAETPDIGPTEAPATFFYDWSKENETLGTQVYNFIEIKFSISSSHESLWYPKNSIPISNWGRQDLLPSIKRNSSFSHTLSINFLLL